VIARLFGESFAENIIVLAPGVWTGPLYSGLGVHLVWVTEHRKARMPDLTEVRVQVEREYLSRRRRELNDKAYAKLRENYEVIIHPWGAQGKAGEAIAATRPAGGDQ
jgi:parvulin-like peptidyl-prolyl isomerase